MSGDLAISGVAAIERNSWKSKCGQDMHSRGQMAYYRHLIRSGAVATRIVFSPSGFVAYRLPMVVDDTVFCLKWSYDESMRHLSPGFILIACDLVNSYGNRQVRQIDLFGSPDRLKDSVCSRSRRRIDVVWPAGRIADDILRERAAHDARNEAVYKSGRGIRAAYMGAA